MSVRRFTADGTYDFKGTISTRLAGEADMHAVTAIHGFLEELHAAAVRLRAAEVVVDLRDLEFANSSCLKGFVRWLTQVQALPAPYRISFLHEPSKYWQIRSLQSLRCFAVDVVSIGTSRASTPSA